MNALLLFYSDIDIYKVICKFVYVKLAEVQLNNNKNYVGVLYGRRE